MNPIRKTILPLLVLLLLVILTVSARSLLITYLVEPVTTLLWVVWRIISGVDQRIYWAVLIVVCAILIIRFIPSGRDKTPKTAYKNINASLNRVAFWQTAFADAGLGKNERDFLRDSLEKLLITVVAQNERSDSNEIERILAEVKGSFSPAAQQYLFPIMGKRRSLSIRFIAPRWFGKGAGILNHQDYAVMDEILKRMEVDLDINNTLEINDER